MPDVDQHVGQCPGCQAWYRQQKVAVAALEKLERYPVPEDFTARVLAQLTEMTAQQYSTTPARRTSVLDSLKQAWSDLAASLSSPMGRRRLAPTLLTAAAAIVVVVCLFALIEGATVPVTPGAATGPAEGVILAGVVVVVVLGALALFFSRRK